MKRKDHNKAFGRVLRELRTQRGFTQETLAFECELDRTYISLLELGSNSPTLDTIMILVRYLGVSFAQLAARIDAELADGKS